MIVDNNRHTLAENTQVAHQCDWDVLSLNCSFIYFVHIYSVGDVFPRLLTMKPSGIYVRYSIFPRRSFQENFFSLIIHISLHLSFHPHVVLRLWLCEHMLGAFKTLHMELIATPCTHSHVPWGHMHSPWHRTHIFPLFKKDCISAIKLTETLVMWFRNQLTLTQVVWFDTTSTSLFSLTTHFWCIYNQQLLKKILPNPNMRRLKGQTKSRLLMCHEWEDQRGLIQPQLPFSAFFSLTIYAT